MRVLVSLLGSLLRIALLPLWLLVRALAKPKGPYVEVRLSPRLSELGARTPLWRRLLEAKQPARVGSVVELWRLCRTLARDESMRGLVVHLPPLHSGYATCESARAALAWLRAQGKQTLVFLPTGGGQRELYVASAAERIFAPPQATLSTSGVAAQVVHLRPLLERLGIKVEVLARGEYKSAAEPLVLDAPSAEAREQLEALTQNMQAELQRALSERPKLGEEGARRAFATGLWRATAARDLGLIDGCCYEDELAQQLGLTRGKHAPFVPHARYLAYRTQRLLRPLRAEPAIGIVRIHGAIAHGEPGPSRRSVANAQTISASLRAAGRNRSIKAVVLHIDSPGGSALASDLIHRELLRLSEHKPVVACMGNVAASGGYYVAAPCRRIVAQATTLTGSIGVISAKLVARELLERAGVRAHTVRTAEHADMMSLTRELTADERALLQNEIDGFYAAFLEVVARGRGMSTEDVDRVARGRVWSGSAAVQHRLVDALGGLERAIDEAIELAPELKRLPRERIALRAVQSTHAQPLPEPAVASAQAAVELLALLETGPTALYYALAPSFVAERC